MFSRACESIDDMRTHTSECGGRECMGVICNHGAVNLKTGQKIIRCDLASTLVRILPEFLIIPIGHEM